MSVTVDWEPVTGTPGPVGDLSGDGSVHWPRGRDGARGRTSQDMG